MSKLNNLLQEILETRVGESKSLREPIFFDEIVDIIKEFSLNPHNIIKKYDELIQKGKDTLEDRVVEGRWNVSKDDFHEHAKCIKRLQSERDQFIKAFSLDPLA